MLIDVSDANTIPMKIKDKIVSSFSNLTSDIIEMIKKKSIDDEDSMMRTIKKCYGYSKTNRLYLDLENILKKYEIVCFHSTKMLSKNRVREYGLNTNEWNKYRANIIDTYERLLEPGRINHSKSDRNSQFELNRNSQCTLAN